MRDYTFYMWIGVWLLVVSLPSFGVPSTWKDTFHILTALFIIGYSVLRFRRTRPKKAETLGTDVLPKEGSNETTESGNTL